MVKPAAGIPDPSFSGRGAQLLCEAVRCDSQPRPLGDDRVALKELYP